MNNKVAIVTGAAQGIGKAYCKALLEQNAKVVIADVNADKGNTTALEFASTYSKDRVIFKKCDVTREEEIEAIYKFTIDTFGYVDIFINNAGILDEGRWELMLDVNLRGVAYGMKMSIKHMAKDNGGKGGYIINTSSNAAVNPSCFVPVYSASKSAILHYSRCIAEAVPFATSGIRIHNLLPALVDTGFTDIKEDTQVVNAKEHNVVLSRRKPLPTEEVARVLIHVLMNEEYKSDVFLIRPEGVHRIIPTYEEKEEICLPQVLLHYWKNTKGKNL